MIEELVFLSDLTQLNVLDMNLGNELIQRLRDYSIFLRVQILKLVEN